jgi:general secretion pathway protein G
MKLPIRSAFFKLVVVVTLASVLLYLASGSNVCRLSPRARENTLKYDLFVLRQAIDNYTLDRQQPPQSLNDLVGAQYIRKIPTDPMTARKDWTLEIGDIALNQGLSVKGLCDVHSSSKKAGLDGTQYSDW